MGIGQSKEGFSVFGIFNQCVSPMGKRLLRLWFRRPIINLTAIKGRQVSMRLNLLYKCVESKHPCSDNTVSFHVLFTFYIRLNSQNHVHYRLIGPILRVCMV